MHETRRGERDQQLKREVSETVRPRHGPVPPPPPCVSASPPHPSKRPPSYQGLPRRESRPWCSMAQHMTTRASLFYLQPCQRSPPSPGRQVREKGGLIGYVVTEEGVGMPNWARCNRELPSPGISSVVQAKISRGLALKIWGSSALPFSPNTGASTRISK